MFPPIHSEQTDYSTEFNTFEYWRESLPEIEESDDLLISLQNKTQINGKTLVNINVKNESIRKKVK